ncbi:MAG: hypothetical protein IPJ31_08520 [Bacteroidetes bacterium]|nr:hypothetical protein [Bacteroidota bacterium]
MLKWGFGEESMERGFNGLSGLMQINTNDHSEVGICEIVDGTRIERIERIYTDKYKRPL